ncbi:MAG: hypothetical protein ACRDPT_15265 [Streptomycetales bacterium]
MAGTASDTWPQRRRSRFTRFHHVLTRQGKMACYQRTAIAIEGAA